MDALRACVGEGKQSAFFQDSGAVPTKLEQEDQEVCCGAPADRFLCRCRRQNFLVTILPVVPARTTHALLLVRLISILIWSSTAFFCFG